MTKRFYCAAALGEAKWADQIAFKLREARHDVISTWHTDYLRKPNRDPMSMGEKARIWEQCKEEIKEATHLVIYTATGRPRATFVELGFFLGLAEESHDMGGVFWISDDAETCPVPVGDSLVTHCASVADLLVKVKT